jgi:hypothetical protein
VGAAANQITNRFSICVQVCAHRACKVKVNDTEFCSEDCELAAAEAELAGWVLRQLAHHAGVGSVSLRAPKHPPPQYSALAPQMPSWRTSAHRRFITMPWTSIQPGP